MIAVVGHVAVLAALVASVAALAASVAAGFPSGNAGLLLVARRCVWAAAAGHGLAALALAWALWTADFQLEYVASHTDRSLSGALRLAAFWSGQEGSLLLWGCLVAGVAVWLSRGNAPENDRARATSLAVMSLLVAFFALLLGAGADPFRTVSPAPLEGSGLQPQLRHWAMVVHPPVLFMGYAGFAAPLALVCGALASGKWDAPTLARIRRWAVMSWAFLGAGMALGAWWAYVELGWGGYWAWDPVENASLMPWLTGTALVHAIGAQERRTGARGWTAGLACVTFALCIFGTFITRSGVLQSVHAFAQSGVGWYFAALLALLLAGFMALVILRRSSLAGAAEGGGASGLGSATVLGGTCLVVMAGLVLVGTIFPLVSLLVMRAPAALAQSFYTRSVAPLGLIVAALMAVSPMLSTRAAIGREFLRSMARPLAAGAIGTGAALAMGLRHPAALAAAGVSILAFSAISVELARAVSARARIEGDGRGLALLRALDCGHRRYGGRLAHGGFFVVIIGVVGSTVFSSSATLTMTRGESIVAGRGSLRLESVRQVQGEGYAAAEAVLTLSTPGVAPRTLLPQQRFYGFRSEGSARVDIASTWREDVYVALVGWKRGGEVATFELHVNPLAVWVWIGAAMLVAGGVLALTPRFLPLTRVARVPAPAPSPGMPAEGRA